MLKTFDGVLIGVPIDVPSLRPVLRVGLFKLTIFHSKNAVGRLDKAVVVSDDDDRRFPVSAELSQQTKHFCASGRIKLAGWLVGANKFWLLEQCSCDGDALLLTARQLVRAMVKPVAQPNLLEHFNGSITQFSRNALREVRDQCVVDGVEIVQQVEALKDESDIVTAVGVAF